MKWVLVYALFSSGLHIERYSTEVDCVDNLLLVETVVKSDLWFARCSAPGEPDPYGVTGGIGP
jgi:hypothetical protein